MAKKKKPKFDEEEDEDEDYEDDEDDEDTEAVKETARLRNKAFSTNVVPASKLNPKEEKEAEEWQPYIRPMQYGLVNPGTQESLIGTNLEEAQLIILAKILQLVEEAVENTR